ncbi:hypothetical protein QO002_004522 [Pararhizobium capsulatum DSM 1112]|uniref:Uncharacterized protein n=1 Tax=Pararhizobium capsulatum DSM 1112 TaxID=1121113 RepID=A0ABU0BVN6_9HYPH|nr:hypothetical protein [Pararhizobium capsulatum]MDQ0322316.1 hypothetical protein [Pararhizobium capsulatum DSM 1112]
MNHTTDFIAELIRAANGVGKLGDSEKHRLLEHAVTMIQDMRRQNVIPIFETLTDPLIPLRITAAIIHRRSNDEVKAALLEAADMIRTLKIELGG